MAINKLLTYFPEDARGELEAEYKRLLKSKASKIQIRLQFFKISLDMLFGILVSKIQDIGLPKRDTVELNRKQGQRENVEFDRATQQHSDTTIFVESLTISGDWKSISKIQSNFKDRDSFYEVLSAIMPAYR